MDNSAQQSMAAAMDRLWTKYLPETEERVAVLEAANRALADDKLSKHHMDDAQSAAHKLAGVLGTFGLTRGTVLAREAEILYSGVDDLDPASLPRLVEIAQQIKAIVGNRK